VSNNNSLSGGDGADPILLEDGFGSATITGGKGGTDGTDADRVDLGAVISAVTVTWTGTEAGLVAAGTDTLAFSEIEEIALTGGDDVIDASLDTGGIRVEGGGGSDRFIGGTGNDWMSGGGGRGPLHPVGRGRQ
jgi:hypothetical protein